MKSGIRSFDTLLLPLFALVLVLSSCKKDPQGSSQGVGDPAAISRLREMGYSDAEIKEVPEGYLVQGELLFLHEYFKAPQPKMALTAAQYMTPVNLPQYSTIRILYTPIGTGAAEEAVWLEAFNYVIARLNSCPNFAITFQVATGNNLQYPQDYQLAVWENNSPYGVDYETYGVTTYATPGMPASMVRLFTQGVVYNTANSAAVNQAKCRYAMAHMLFHSIGFAHVDAALHNRNIFGTPNQGQDLNSVLSHGGIYGNFPSPPRSWNEATMFSYWDKLSLALIYPDFPRLAGTVALYQYRRVPVGSTPVEYFYTIDWYEKRGPLLNTTGYNYEGIAGYICNQPFPGTIQFRRYRNTISNMHLYTYNTNEVAGNPNWVEEPIGPTPGYVFLAQAAGTLPLYRFGHPVTGAHWYSTAYAPPAGFVYEGVAGYVYPKPV